VNRAGKAARLGRRLRGDRSGLAMTEFALIIPFFLTAGLGGLELANYSYQTMLVNEVAAHIADNASRIGDYSKLQNRKIYESDIDDLLVGANMQAGSQLNLFNGGRVIISSLEVNSSGKQYIHWQRCIGTKRVGSSYGVQGEVRSVGMGPVGSEVFAFNNEAVMFVEIQYDYKPMISTAFLGKLTISSIASFTVRSSRDLAQIYQTTPASPVMSCDKYGSTIA
jgi:hypothetical protein